MNELKSKNPKISAIMAVYNTQESYLRPAIESVLNQSFEDFEFIIINDNSTNNAEEIIKSYDDARIVYLKNEENMSAAYVRNRGLEIAKGEYVAIVDSDDVAAFDLFEVLHDFLSKNPDYALAVGENKIIDDKGTICYWDFDRNIVYEISEAFYYSYCDYMMKWATNINYFGDDFGSYPKLLLGNHIPNGYLIRKSIFDKTGFYAEKPLIEDYYLMLQIAKYAKMKYIPKTLFYYRWHQNNATQFFDVVHEKGKETRRYELEIVKKLNDPKITKYMKDYINSFPKNYLVKIPFVFELYSRKTRCNEELIMKLLGAEFTIINKNI